MDQYAIEIGLAVLVLIAAIASWTGSRGRYVKSADFKHSIEALRLEFRRSLNETRTTTSKRATAIGDNLVSVIKPIDLAVTDLNVRLGKLEEHADAVSSFMAGPQRQALEDNQRIDARLMKVEQRVTALVEQLSFIQQTIDEVTTRDREIDKSLKSLNSRLMDAQRQADELFSRVDLGEKARADLGSLIGLFVKQLKRVNVNAAETALRVADLEGLRSQVRGLEERLNSPVDVHNHPLIGNVIGNGTDLIGNTEPGAGAAVGLAETNNGTDTSTVEQPMTSAEEPPDHSGVRMGNRSDNGGADQHRHDASPAS